MKTSLLSLAVALVAGTFTLPTEVASAASGKSGSVGSTSHVSHHSGNRTFTSHGRSFSCNTFSRSYNGWSRYCWFPSYGCYGYYCPTDYSWYFYSGTYACYLPVTYINTIAPTPVNANANANANVNTNVNVNVNGLPAGATQLPVGVVPPLPGAPK
jgi:hypothetical protein